MTHGASPWWPSPQRRLCLALVLVALAPRHAAGQQAPCPEIDTASVWVRASRAWSNERDLQWSNDSLRHVLLTLQERDQAARSSFGTSVGDSLYVRELSRLDSALAVEMDTILQRFGLPTRDMVGPGASDAAMLIIQHNWPLQRRALALAEALPSGQISPEKMAMLEDRILVHEGSRQRYGTQLTIGPDGVWRFAAVEDAPGLAARRAAAGMPPLDLYVCLMEESGMRVDRESLPVVRR